MSIKKFINCLLVFVLSVLFQKSKAQNVGIGTNAPTRAGLVVTQKSGETFALFGADGNSTSITGSFLNNNVYRSPTIGFNMYHNNGDKRIVFAHAGKILYDQIEGDFHFMSSEAGAPDVSITEYKRPLTIYNSGNVLIGATGTKSAGLMVTQKFGETLAIFGTEANSTSITGSFLNNNVYRSPTIGFNMYHNNGDKRIGFAHAGKILYDQIEGDFHFLSSEAGAPDLTISDYKRPLSIYRNGHVAVGANSNNTFLGGLIVNSKIGGNNAVFGSNTTGVSIESDFPGIGLNSYFSVTRRHINNGYAGLIGLNPVNGNFYVLSSEVSATAFESSTFNTRFLINNAGNIGIQGNTNPRVPLSFAASLGNKLGLWVNNAGAHYGFGIQASLLQMYTPANTDDIAFGIGNSESFTENVRFKGNGNVGIGTLSPVVRFQVGNNGDGTVARANAWQTFSDERFKKDIVPIPNALEKLDALNGYYYYWKEGADEHRQAGLMAQEVEKVLPEIVNTDNQGYKSVDYGKMNALLIQALKEQNKKVEALQEQINQLIKIIEKK
jgi:hypothetical protein